ncbi:unnamed protein product [Linum trigynum]|uniref:Uncharacterized protein n=1 Tax=Linum trigynum TaxID=586398 RepID=A0AAV2CHS3_9ROSI
MVLSFFIKGVTWVRLMKCGYLKGGDAVSGLLELWWRTLYESCCSCSIGAGNIWLSVNDSCDRMLDLRHGAWREKSALPKKQQTWSCGDSFEFLRQVLQ